MLLTRPVDFRFRPDQFIMSDIITEYGISSIIFCLFETTLIKLYLNKFDQTSCFIIHENPNKVMHDIKNFMSFENLTKWLNSTNHEFDPNESSIMINT